MGRLMLVNRDTPPLGQPTDKNAEKTLRHWIETQKDPLAVSGGEPGLVRNRRRHERSVVDPIPLLRLGDATLSWRFVAVYAALACGKRVRHLQLAEFLARESYEVAVASRMRDQSPARSSESAYTVGRDPAAIRIDQGSDVTDRTLDRRTSQKARANPAC